jgi:hypothetical protein
MHQIDRRKNIYPFQRLIYHPNAGVRQIGLIKWKHDGSTRNGGKWLPAAGIAKKREYGSVK